MTHTNQKINILEIIHKIDCTNRIVLNFCKGINREWFEAKVLSEGKVGGKEQDFTRIGTEYVIADKNIEVVKEAIKKWKIDIIHMHRSGHYDSFQYELYRQAKLINPNIIILETNFFGKFDEKSFPLIDCSLQVSKMMLNERYIKEVGRFDFEKTKIVYHPIDCAGWDAIQVSEADIQAYKNKLGIREGDFVIGKLCRPAIEKWSDLLLYMMPYLVKLVPNIKFIVQEMPESRKRRVRASKYKDHYILLPATLDDREVALFFKTIDVYTHTSKIGESFGMTLAEAGVFKKPVVINSTPDRDNNQLEMIEYMKTGIIANHPQTFARAVEYLYKHKDLRFQMGEAAREKVARMYDPKRTAEQLEKIAVEKMVQNNQYVDPKIISYYKGVDFYPSQEEILAYKEEYKKRLKQEFGELSIGEVCINVLNKPRQFYFKVRDFLEHRFGI